MLKQIFAALVALSLSAGFASACGHQVAVATCNHATATYATQNYATATNYQATYNPTVQVQVVAPVYNQVVTTVIKKVVAVPYVQTHQAVTQTVVTRKVVVVHKAVAAY